MNPYSQRYAHEEVKEKSLDYTIIKRLLTYLRPYRLWVIFAIIILIISKAIEAWVPLQIGAITQAILNHDSFDSIIHPDLFHAVVRSSFFVMIWILVTYLLDTANIFVRSWVGQRAILTMRTEIYQHIQRLPINYYDHHAVGKLMTRTIHDVDQINQLFSDSVVPIIGSSFLFLSILIGIFFLNWRIGLAILFILPLIWGFTHYFRINQRRSYDVVRSIVSAMNSFIQEQLMGVSIIRTFNLSQSEKKKFDELNEDHYKANMETVHYFAFFFAGIEFLQSLSLIIVFVILVVFASVQGGFQAGTFFTLSLYGMMVFRPLADLAERYNILQSAMAAGERIFEILDTPLEPTGAQPGLPLNAIESVEFDHVWFAYEKDNWILKDISFSIHRNESVALIGVTGAGKTTILNLLMRFHELQKGKILINGHDIRDYAVSTLRSQFSMILQDPVIFSGTVSDNIALYDRSITPEQIQASADFVNLTPSLNQWQDGLDHLLTERGTSLSVGEMQLISLARAVAHQRSMLIFDEATSNIDIHTEKLIQQALKKILPNKTALVIAHRLSTIKDVHRIMVLYGGKIVESGSHHELLKAKGIYEKLYRLQFSVPKESF